VLGSGFGQSDGMMKDLIEKEWTESRIARRIANFIASTEEDGNQIGLMMETREGPQIKVD
jgi:hypothetical protein